jgi:CspA family cold shock protein
VKTGTVKFYNEAKGFGFVRQDDGSPDVFLHVSGLIDRSNGEPKEGDRIEFDVGESRGRPCAELVRILS